MCKKFTDRARKVMQFANGEAQRFNHEYVGTEHVLLGLIKEGDGVAGTALRTLGADLGKVRLEVEKLSHSGPGMGAMGKLHQAPCVEKVIEYASEEACTLGHNYVGTEHLLLGLLRKQDGIAAKVLANVGLDTVVVRREVMGLLGNYSDSSARHRGNTDPIAMEGFSPRDWFAGQAMAAIAAAIWRLDTNESEADIADAAYSLADAMIARRRTVAAGGDEWNPSTKPRTKTNKVNA